MPAVTANLFEILQTGIPAVEQNIFRREASAFGDEEHLPKVIVLRSAIVFAENAVIDGEFAVAVGPKQGDQVDALDDFVMLARPVFGHQINVFCVRFVEGRIVNNQDAFGLFDEWLRLLPEDFRVGFETLQEPSERVMSGRIRRVGLHACGLGAGESPRGSDKKIDIVDITATGSAHAAILRPISAKRNWSYGH